MPEYSTLFFFTINLCKNSLFDQFIDLVDLQTIFQTDITYSGTNQPIK